MKRLFWLVVFLLVVSGGIWKASLPEQDRRIAERPGEAVVLLHGLGRTSKSMDPLAKKLRESGYQVVNVDYPSRDMTVEEIVEDYVGPTVRTLLDTGAEVHFVTHSMGGVIVRQYLQNRAHDCPGKIVMLAPPNKGSEIIDTLGRFSLFGDIMGPASLQLSTAVESLPNRLGPVSCKVGVIAGDVSLNPLTSMIVAGEDDGKVSVAGTKLDGSDHLVVHASHTFIMNRADVIGQVLYFLENGSFE